MAKRVTILLLAVFVNAVSQTSLGANRANDKLLRDGFILRGIDGKVSGSDSNEGWSFEFDSDVSDDRGKVAAGTSLNLLPSRALEKMVADANSLVGQDCRIWGRVTRYKDRNYIFPVYFLHLDEAEKSEPSNLQKSEPEAKVKEPSDELEIPPEIMARLEARRIIRPRQPEKRETSRQDSIVADRTGFILPGVGCDVNWWGEAAQYDFVFDALGRENGEDCLRLLPCRGLELAEHRQLAEPEPIRLKMAGIITEYKGNKYLLLHKATRVYSYGNFGR